MNPDGQGICPECQQWMSQMCAHYRDLVVKTLNDVWAGWWTEAAPALYKNVAEVPVLDCDKLSELLELDEDMDGPEVLPLQYEDLSCWQKVALIFIYVVILVLLAVACRIWRGERHVHIQPTGTDIVSARHESITSDQFPAPIVFISEQPSTSEESTKSKRSNRLRNLLKRSKKNSPPVSKDNSKYNAPSKSKGQTVFAWGEEPTADSDTVLERSPSKISTRRPTGFPKKDEIPEDDSPPLSERPSRSVQPIPIIINPTTSQPPTSTGPSEHMTRARIYDESPTTLSPSESQRPTFTEEPENSNRAKISHLAPTIMSPTDSERESYSDQPSKSTQNAEPRKSTKEKMNKIKAWMRYKFRPIFVHNQSTLRRQQNKYKENERVKQLITQKNIEKWTKAREKNIERKQQIARESAEKEKEAKKKGLFWIRPSLQKNPDKSITTGKE